MWNWKFPSRTCFQIKRFLIIGTSGQFPVPAARLCAHCLNRLLWKLVNRGCSAPWSVCSAVPFACACACACALAHAPSAAQVCEFLFRSLRPDGVVSEHLPKTRVFKVRMAAGWRALSAGLRSPLASGQSRRARGVVSRPVPFRPLSPWSPAGRFDPGAHGGAEQIRMGSYFSK